MGMRLFDFLIDFLTSGFFSFFLDFLGLDRVDVEVEIFLDTFYLFEEFFDLRCLINFMNAMHIYHISDSSLVTFADIFAGSVPSFDFWSLCCKVANTFVARPVITAK